MTYFLAGDVGGTKTRLAIYDLEGQKAVQIAVKQYVSAQYSGLAAILSEFLSERPEKPTIGCVGVPGPVIKGEVKVTNLPWRLSEIALERDSGLKRLRLVNDLTATTAAVPYLTHKDLHTVKAGESPGLPAVSAVVAPGTGHGMGFLYQDASISTILPSEGGHASFAPSNEEQQRLLSFLRDRNENSSHISVEDILSGPGIRNLFDFVIYDRKTQIPAELTSAFSNGDDAAVIAARALDGSDPLCLKTLELFVSILGSHSGNVAVTTMARGGVFLGGGIPPRILPLIDSDHFRKAFTDKGKMKNLVEGIPVYVIRDDYAALVGASVLARRE
jgi:glucokinase